MVTYEQLYHLDLAKLQKAADAWEGAARKLKALRSEFRDSVEQPFTRAGWTSSEGTSGSATTLVKSTGQEFGDAATEASAIAAVLHDAHGDLKKCKDELIHLAEVEAPAQDLTVSGAGVVTPRHDLSQDPAARHDPDARQAISDQRTACGAFAVRLTQVLQRASEADAQAAWALLHDAGTDANDFNASVVRDLDDAAKYMASEGHFTDAESYIFAEMKTNIQSAAVKNIQALLRPPEWYEFGRNYGNDINAALVLWGAKVAPKQDWDHKPKLQDRYDLQKKDDFYFKAPGQNKAVYYDIYSNIHYGYVGRAAGFDPTTLIKGASLGETLLTGDDDEGDQITMRVGMELYDKYGANLTQDQLHQGILDAMSRMDKAKQEGKDVIQIRNTE